MSVGTAAMLIGLLLRKTLWTKAARPNLWLRPTWSPLPLRRASVMLKRFLSGRRQVPLHQRVRSLRPPT